MFVIHNPSHMISYIYISFFLSFSLFLSDAGTANALSSCACTYCLCTCDHSLSCSIRPLFLSSSRVCVAIYISLYSIPPLTVLYFVSIYTPTPVILLNVFARKVFPCANDYGSFIFLLIFISSLLSCFSFFPLLFLHLYFLSFSLFVCVCMYVCVSFSFFLFTGVSII